MDERLANAYEDLTFALAQDPDDDVTVTDEGLFVHGRRFAYRDGDLLVVQLPETRVQDLEKRGIVARRPEHDGWAAVVDPELWLELAGESHTFVGEPAVGGQS